MKIRCIADLPFAKLGAEFYPIEIKTGDSYYVFDNLSVTKAVIEEWIGKGFFEEVIEEKSLSMKFLEAQHWFGGPHCEELATIAREHCLRVFDEARLVSKNQYLPHIIGDIRQALEEKMK